MRYKDCPRCEELLPETCFFVDKNRKSGLRPYCKACEAELRAAWRIKTGRTKTSYILPTKVCSDQ